MISDYFLLFITLFAVVLSVYFTGLLYQRIEVLKLAAISISLFFTGYVLCSGFYFLLDQFQFSSVLLTECLCLALGIAVLIIRKKKVLFVVKRKSRSMWVYALILCSFLISAQKFSFFGMGQDQGVYQTKAIALAYGYTQRQFDFEEYQLLETDEQREAYRSGVAKLIGYYTNEPIFSPNEKLSPVSAIFHGIPTFPAVLGLMVKIFGVASMQSVQSVFLVCALLFVLFTAENLELKRSSQYLSLAIVAFSPIVQWVMKSALTEGFLVLIFAWFIYHITDKEYSISRLLSALPICAFAFWHVTIFTIMPLFICLYIVAYEETRSKIYIYMGILALLFFAMGNAMMMHVSPYYVSFNVRFGLGFLEASKIVSAFIFACALIILFLLFIDVLRFDVFYKWFRQEHIFPWVVRGVMVISAVMICKFAVEAWTGEYTSSHYGIGIAVIPHLTIVVFIFGTGMVVLPLCLLVLFFAPSKMLHSKNTLLVTAMFFYCVILMAAFLRKDVPSSYYYTRYLAPFIVVCGVTAGVITDMMSLDVTSAVLICALVGLLPYDWVLLTQKDDSHMEWSVLSEIASCITEKGAVVFDSAYYNSRILMLPIKTMTGADVYPAFEQKAEQIDFLLSNYKDVFVVTYDTMNIAFLENNRANIVYLNKYTASEDTGNKRNPITQFPQGFSSQTVEFCVLKCHGDKLDYDLSASDTVCGGFYGVENNNFRWASNNALLEVFLPQKDYLMNITQGPGIPFSLLEKGSIRVNVNLNGHLIQSFDITKENSNQNIQIMIPRQYLKDGKNTIKFYGETWSPSEYGSGDGRELLFSVSKVTFAETDLSVLDFGEQEYFWFSGFSGNEGSFRWTNESPAEIKPVALSNEKNYQCSIVLGPSIPIKVLEQEGYEGRIVINGDEDAAISFSLEPGQNTIDFQINKELLTDESNTIQLYTPLWSPSDYGSEDTRELGIAINKITFTPQG